MYIITITKIEIKEHCQILPDIRAVQKKKLPDIRELVLVVQLQEYELENGE
jgi:hypothetical protein